MKKIISILLGVFLMFSFTACTDKDDVKPAEGVYESENAKFTVKADKTSIKGETDQVTIIVEATVKKDFDSGITYGTEKNTCMVIECYMQTNGKEYKLYNDYDSLQQPDPVMDFHFEKGEIVERTLLFSRLPLIDNIDYQAVPQGEYKVRIRFNGDASWTETDIIINAK